jgi:SpoVK/Ycf46/Vps4 family AAA+-type ATPase
MDGLSTLGQILIGATNLPSVLDPALHRPGHFSREIYFTLFSISARQSILLLTQKRVGWEPSNERARREDAEEFGGYDERVWWADLRVLCTEAALNAVQRTYPQIYRNGRGW